MMRNDVTEPLKIQRGGMWEDPEWEIRFDEKCDGDKDVMCPHCHSFVVEKHQAWNGDTYDKPTFVCPRVVVAYNEGGYNTTGVCLDCVLEAAGKLAGAAQSTTSQKK